MWVSGRRAKAVDFSLPQSVRTGKAMVFRSVPTSVSSPYGSVIARRCWISDDKNRYGNE
jgi:hypothetical protein